MFCERCSCTLCLRVCWTLLTVWAPWCFLRCLCVTPSPTPLIDHVAHYKSKAAVALLQVANEGSFLTWLNGPDKESNEEINNLAIVALLILIHPACSAGIQWKAGYFFTVLFLRISMFFSFFCRLIFCSGLVTDGKTCCQFCKCFKRL